MGLSALVLTWSVQASAQPEPPSPEEPDEGEPPVEPEPVKPPVLKTFIRAPYPASERDSGQEASVELQLDIDANGAVTNVVVLESAGTAFDEAAAEAARAFEFDPAVRGETAVPSRIRYRYEFKLEPAKPETEEAPPAELSGALTIRGIGAKLSFAKVTAVAADGTRYETESDNEGAFRFPALPAGKYTVIVVAEGYQRLQLQEELASGEALEVVYRLDVARGLNEVLIVGERPSEEAAREVTRRTLTREQLQRVPGTGGDALKAIQSLPGVARPPGIAGLLIVRGSAPEETGVFIDGTQVPILYHFGGLTSVIPTEMLERIDFYPSNFNVRFGRLRGSVIDVGLRSPNTQCERYGEPTGEEDCFHGMLQLDLVDVRLMASGPLSDEWSFAAAARRSWVDAWLGPVLESTGGTSVTAAPVYYDYQAIVEHRPSKREKLSLRFFGSDDKIRLIFDEPPPNNPGAGGQLALATRFLRGQLLYEGRPDPDIELKGMIAGGWTATDFSLGNNLDFDFDFFPIEYRGEIGFDLTDFLTVRAGIDYSVTKLKATVFAPDPLRPGEQVPGTLVSVKARQSNPDGTLHRPALYAEADVRPHPRVQVVPGIRADYTRSTTQAKASPRIHGRYNLFGPEIGERGPWKPRTTIKAGAGVFRQPPEIQETDDVFGTPGIEDTRAIHYSVGFEQEITEQIEVGLEGYYKDLDNLVSRRPDPNGDFLYNNEGVGHVVGAEVLLQYKPDDIFFGWLAYSLSRSVRQDLPELDERLFQYDQTHNLTVLGSFKLGAGWEAGARFRLISGNPFTPYQERLPAIYAADGTEYVPINDEPFSDRLPVHHQLDVRIDKKWQFEHWAFSAYLDVQNVYNRQAREAISYNYNYTEEEFQLGLPILPSLGLRGEF